MKPNNVCEICGYPMLKNIVTKHHLIPKQMRKNPNNKFDGNGTIKLHKLCHAMLHVFFDNKHLATELNTKSKLKSNMIVQRYIQFIRHSPTDFYIKSNYALTAVKEVKNKILSENNQ
jgi:hypothetical protein